MASISKYKTESGKQRWKVSVYIGVDPKTGKKKYKVKGGKKNRAEAIAAGRELEQLVANGELTVDPTPKAEQYTLRQVFEFWSKTYKLQVRESSWAKTKDCLELHIVKDLGDVYIDKLTPLDLQNAVEKWRKVAPVNFRRYYVYCNKMLNYAVKFGYIDENPAPQVEMPRQKEKIQEANEWWTREQLRTFFACINPKRDLKKYALFRILAFGGLRIGECLALEWEDVNFEKKTLSITKTMAQGLHGRLMINPPKTPASKRVVPIDDETIVWLRMWRAEQADTMRPDIHLKARHQPLFTTWNNQYLRPDKPRLWLTQIIKNNSLTPVISLHKFRKSYISNLLIAGANIKSVQKLVGHSSPEITLKIYAQVNQEQEIAAIKKLTDYMNGEPENDDFTKK